MTPIQHLYDSINQSPYVKFVKSTSAPDSHDSTNSDELLEITSPDNIEHFSMWYSSSAVTSVRFESSSAKETLNNLKKLKLPSSPTNIGELVFRFYQNELECFDDLYVPVDFQKNLIFCREDQFMLVLKKLTHVYSGGIINSDFYEMLRNQK